MYKSYKAVFDEYVKQGMLNKDAYLLSFQQPSGPLEAKEEFLLDAFVNMNARVGKLIRQLSCYADLSDPLVQQAVEDTLTDVCAQWSVHGAQVQESWVKFAQDWLPLYVRNCFDVRAQGLFRNNEAYRSRLYSVMARHGLSRTQCRDKLECVISHITSAPHDEFTDVYLDSIVAQVLSMY